VLDFPFLDQAAGARGGNYFQALQNPSMRQAMAITQDLHSSNYYLNNQLWDRWINPDTKKRKWLNRLAANLSAGAVDLVLSYQLMLFSPVWLHEEYHRSSLTVRGIHSRNHVFQALVDQVSDADLIALKAQHPQ